MSTYVKFMRGTPQSYAKLHPKDNDTLYFIYAKDGDTTTGHLYLGDKQIVCNDNENLVTSLSQLTDVQLSDPLIDEQLLVYHLTEDGSGYWTAKNIEDLARVFPEADNKSVTYNTDNKLSLVGFVDAETGAQPVKAENGSISWIKPNTTTVEGLSQAIEILENDVANLSSELGNPVGADGTPATGLYAELDKKIDATDVYTKTETDITIETAIAGTNHLSRKIVEKYEDINPMAENADKFIYIVPNEKGSYDEYIIIDRVIDRIGDQNINLDDYATKEDLKQGLDDGSRLITSAEIIKLDNSFESVSSDFTITQEKVLILNSIPTDRIIGLNDTLMAVDEKITNLEKIINGYTNENGETIFGLIEKVNALQTTINSLENIYATKEELNILNEHLTWQELTMTE